MTSLKKKARSLCSAGLSAECSSHNITTFVTGASWPNRARPWRCCHCGQLWGQLQNKTQPAEFLFQISGTEYLVITQTHDIEVSIDGVQRVLGRTPGIKQYVITFNTLLKIAALLHPAAALNSMLYTWHSLRNHSWCHLYQSLQYADWRYAAFQMSEIYLAWPRT